jgi:hypothetical protein
MTKYLLIQHYDGGVCDVPMGDWDPADIRSHLDYQRALTEALIEAGELVDAQGVAERAARVTSDGGVTRVHTGPFSEKLLAGYRIVDVESEARAVEVAARMSAAPGPAGMPLQQPVEIREVMVPHL